MEERERSNMVKLMELKEAGWMVARLVEREASMRRRLDCKVLKT